MAVRRDPNLNKTLFERILRGFSRGFRSFLFPSLLNQCVWTCGCFRCVPYIIIGGDKYDLLSGEGFPRLTRQQNTIIKRSFCVYEPIHRKRPLFLLGFMRTAPHEEEVLMSASTSPIPYTGNKSCIVKTIISISASSSRKSQQFKICSPDKPAFCSLGFTVTAISLLFSRQVKEL